jgi:hypothetical protein
VTVAFDAVGPSGGGGANIASGTSLTWTHTCTAGATDLIVGVAVGDSTPGGMTLTATYNGVSMTAIGSVASNNQTAGFVKLFRLANPTSGANTVAVTAGSSSGTKLGGSISYTGGGAVGTAVTNFGNSGTASCTVSGSTGNMVVSAACIGSQFIGTSNTQRVFDNHDSGSAAGNLLMADAASGASVTMSDSGSADWWGIVAVEIQAAGGGGAVSGDATESVTSSITAAGTVGKVGTAPETITSAITATGVVGRSGDATETVTSSVSASGTVGKVTGASLTTNVSISASGTVSSGPAGDATVTETVGISAAGTVGKVAGASPTVTSIVAATGVVGISTGSTLSVSVGISASGTVTAAAEPHYRVVFPVHEEPMRTDAGWVKHFHLTHALSLVKVGGVWQARRLTGVPEAVFDTLVDGQTLFRGGCKYEVPQSISDELIAAGFPTEPI